MTKFRIISTLILLLGVFHYGMSQNSNRPLPAGIYPYEFTQHQPVDGYYLTAPFNIGQAVSFIPMILDADGYLVWYMNSGTTYNMDFKFFAPNNHFGFCRHYNAHNSFQLMDTSFQVVDSFTNVNGIGPDTHEFILLSNGNYLISGSRDSVIDLSTDTFNGNPGSPVCNINGFVLQEFTPSHALVFEWNSNVYIHPREWNNTYPYNPANFDYCHGNAVAEDLDGNLLISFRHLNAVYKIDHTTGGVIWKLGGQSSDFTFTNDSGFSGQHDIRVLGDGHISLFDNSNSSPPPHHTRAVEYSIDTNTRTATRIWEYVYSPLLYSSAMGNHQVTPSQYHLINYGLGYRPAPSFVLTDDAGNLMSEVFFTDSVMSYRTHFYESLPFQFHRPEITCTNTGNSLLLSAPSGYTSYRWSTGDTVQSIITTSTGTYQVWVNTGEGMTGSLPFQVNSLTACNSGLEDPSISGPLSITGFYDLLGRRIQAPVPGQVYLVRYSNGSVEKKIKPY